MGIKSVHPDYADMLPEWKECRAGCAGQREIKKLAKDLIKIPGSKAVGGTVTYDPARFSSYLKGAIYTNVSGRTKKGLVGAAFRESPEINITGKIAYLVENADGGGQSIEQMSKDILSSLIETGRELLFADYPVSEEGMTAAQITALKYQASIKRYGALDLDDWATSVIGGKTVVTMLKLRESYNSSDDEFDHDDKIQYRVLRLAEEEGYSGMVFTQQVYREEVAFTERLVAKGYRGQPFNYIPAVCVGSQNNDISVDEIPIADIVHVNVGHFQNSADQEESAFVTGQAMLEIDMGDMEEEDWKEANGSEGIAFGSTTAIRTKGGRVGIVQGAERTVYLALREEKMKEMIALGARLIESRDTLQTATAAKIDATGQNSVLGDLVGNLEDGIRFMLECCAEYEGEQINAEEAIKYSRSFFPDDVDPQIVMAALQGYDRGIVPKSQVQNTFRRSGVVDRNITNEDLNNEIGTASPIE